MRRFTPLSLLAAVSLLVGCGDDQGNPFTRFSLSRPPSEDAVALFVSGSSAESPGGPRELFAINADGTAERLTSCTQSETPCDFIGVAPSTDRERISAIRGSVEGDPLASALYFMDLGRSVETILSPARRVGGADWALTDTYVVYSTGDIEDLRVMRPNGDEDRALTESDDFRERLPRFDPTASFMAYEGLSETPGKSGIFFFFGTQDAASVVTEGGPGTEPLEGTPYIVGSDSAPAFSPNGRGLVFRRLTGTGNGGLGTWDIYVLAFYEEDAEPVLVVGGDGLYRGAPDWGPDGRILFVETDAAEGVSRLVAILPDGTGREVLYSEDAAFGMGSPRWLRPPLQ